MQIEPQLGPLEVRTDTIEQSPEARRVIHFDHMRTFVRRKIIEHVARREDEPP